MFVSAAALEELTGKKRVPLVVMFPFADQADRREATYFLSWLSVNLIVLALLLSVNTLL